MYVFGGTGEFESYASVEAYDMVAQQWLSPVRPMPSVRYGAAACAAGEWIYLLGGITDNGVEFVYSNTIERYHPRTDTWQTLPDSLAVRRAFHQAVVMGDSILIVGGLGGAESYLDARALSSVEVLVVSTEEILPGPTLPNNVSRFAFGAAQLGGRAYVLGGLRSEFMDRAVDTAESVISIGADETQWRTERPLSRGVPPGAAAPRHGFAACAADHAIWIVGGAQRLDPANTGQTSTVLKYYP